MGSGRIPAHDLKNRGVKTLFATHYHELTELARTKPRVKNFNIAVKEWNDEIIFLRKLVEGGVPATTPMLPAPWSFARRRDT